MTSLCACDCVRMHMHGVGCICVGISGRNSLKRGIM